MQEVLANIQNDSILMLIVGIIFVVLLVVVLVVVVSSMYVKTYKDRFIHINEECDDKTELILSLEKELQEYKINNAANEEELKSFSETRNLLSAANALLSSTQKDFSSLEKEQCTLISKHENIQLLYNNLLDENKKLQEQTAQIQEENSKLRINNARLLMKLETESRVTSQLKDLYAKRANSQ